MPFLQAYILLSVWVSDSPLPYIECEQPTATPIDKGQVLIIPGKQLPKPRKQVLAPGHGNVGADHAERIPTHAEAFAAVQKRNVQRLVAGGMTEKISGLPLPPDKGPERKNILRRLKTSWRNLLIRPAA